MKTQVAAITVFALALIGCDGGVAPAKQSAPTIKAITVANPYHDGLVKLDTLRRDSALRSAIRQAKESCDRVETSAFQQDYDNLKMWVATCQRTAYALFIAPTGDVQVRKCEDMATLKLPACSLPEAAPAAKS
ncbi:MAG TPA: hypothetical protein VEZ48_10715 [Sphingomonadaceae bacterium]|nr:hypothetical protein [Sphingomonadaceae bacterium]